MNFSAVILAGGKSSRMGRDKAFLEFRGQTLLARQISLVRQTGAAEVFISGRAGVDYFPFGCPVLQDEVADMGPLAGIATALKAAREPLLLVLAVDMPDITSQFLKKLHDSCHDGLGTVPMHGEIIEPLAAFYPTNAFELIQKTMADARPEQPPGARHFAKACVEVGLARLVVIQRAEAALFKSWNTPSEVDC